MIRGDVVGLPRRSSHFLSICLVHHVLYKVAWAYL